MLDQQRVQECAEYSILGLTDEIETEGMRVWPADFSIWRGIFGASGKNRFASKLSVGYMHVRMVILPVLPA